MNPRILWPPQDRRSRRPRFPYRGAGTLLVLAVAGTLFALWSVRAPERPSSSSGSLIERTVPPSPPEPVPETPREEPAPLEADACPEGCPSPKPGCDIKGNIAVDDGERIYHLPGQRWYGKTVISPEKGERWFCTEEEAEANGWRRAKV